MQLSFSSKNTDTSFPAGLTLFNGLNLHHSSLVLERETYRSSRALIYK
jgi:hypothetical protein